MEKAFGEISDGVNKTDNAIEDSTTRVRTWYETLWEDITSSANQVATSIENFLYNIEYNRPFRAFVRALEKENHWISYLYSRLDVIYSSRLIGHARAQATTMSCKLRTGHSMLLSNTHGFLTSGIWFYLSLSNRFSL